MINYDSFCKKVLFSGETISQAIDEIAKKINSDFDGEEVVFVTVLNGAFMFATDLIKKIKLDCYIDFIQCSSYGDGTTTTRKTNIKKDLSLDITNKNVIIVEDILDSGYTLKNLIDYLQSKNPKCIKTAVFMDKTARREVEIDADYVAVTQNEDEFIIGYGLDYAQKYRNLPFVGVLKEEIYK